MAAALIANANPEKRLFISLLTRDISLIAAFLDLIDNSVNAAVSPLSHRLRTADDYVALLNDPSVQPGVNIHVNLSRDKISVIDSASGISADIASQHVFKFGRSEDEERDSDRLSVYGLGLKRAFFKLGNRVSIVSDHVEGGFSLDLDVSQWSQEATFPWKFDLTRREAVDQSDTGTRIEVTELYSDTVKRIEDGIFPGQLRESAASTYAYFLSSLVRIYVNTAYAHGSGCESLPPDVEVGVRAGERVECSLYVPADGATT